MVTFVREMNEEKKALHIYYHKQQSENETNMSYMVSIEIYL